MNKDIVEFVAKCQICQQLKYRHLRFASFLQRMLILEWKWEIVAMDFVVGIRQSLGKFDSNWVVIDRLTKLVNFIPERIDYIAFNTLKVL